MHLKKYFILLILLIAQPALAKTSDWKLSMKGFGPIEIGMTLKEAAAKSGKSFRQTAPDKAQGEDTSCFTTTLKTNDLDGVSFMVSDKKIARININSKGILTTRGAEVGDSESRVQSLYHKKLTSEPHKYEEKGHYLTYVDKTTDRAIRFETDGKKVTRMYAGKNNEVHFVEDCL